MASLAAHHVQLQKLVSLALDVLLLDTFPVCGVCMHLIALNVRLHSPRAQERVQL